MPPRTPVSCSTVENRLLECSLIDFVRCKKCFRNIKWVFYNKSKLFIKYPNALLDYDYVDV